jgi:hypothetical protein
MLGEGRRWVVLTTIVASCALVALLGLAVHESAGHADEHAVHCGVAVCVVIATLLVPVAYLGPQPARTRLGFSVEPHGVVISVDPPLEARASPGWLQRFRN